MSMTVTSSPPPLPDPKAQLRRKAEELEAAFLSEMLGHTGMGSTSESFGGGIGEAQFASLLRNEQAAGMVKAGGIGLAEQFYRSLAGGAGHDL